MSPVSELPPRHRRNAEISGDPGHRALHGLTFAALEEALRAAQLKTVHAGTLWRALYRDFILKPETFPPPLRRWIDQALRDGSSIALPRIVNELESSDRLTRKLLLELSDGQRIETVIMAYPGRVTLCLSTQAGCAMGCVFCATGQRGFARHLAAHEIVCQVLIASQIQQRRGEEPPRNLVIMGMGEPLHNYDQVMQALEIICDPRGIAIGPARVAISTVGVVPGILRLAEERRPYRLAVSLHATTNEERLKLVPASRRWPLETLIEACRTYGLQTRRRIFFEYTLIAGRNDSAAQAERLAQLLGGIDAHVNIIPLNGTTGFSGRASPPHSVGAFQSRLRASGLPCTVRQRRGLDVAAGCGQLRANADAAAPRPFARVREPL